MNPWKNAGVELYFDECFFVQSLVLILPSSTNVLICIFPMIYILSPATLEGLETLSLAFLKPRKQCSFPPYLGSVRKQPIMKDLQTYVDHDTENIHCYFSHAKLLFVIPPSKCCCSLYASI